VSRFLDCYFLEITTFHTSNFRKVVQQHTEGMVGKYYMGFAGNLLGFPAVKEF